MSNDQGNTTRRSFFLQGGALLGAGVAATAATGALAASARPDVDAAADREAVRQLHSQFLRHIESGNYGAVAALFDAKARLELSAPAINGERAIGAFFAGQYAERRADVLHGAYRRGATQPDDVVTVHADGMQATASFAVEAQLCAPLSADCTAAEMARLQGHFANVRWEAGRFDVSYVKRPQGWRIAALKWWAA